jgi:ATP diphosphatase
MNNSVKEITISEQEAIDFGFNWTHPDQIFDQIQSECQEIREVLDDPSKRDELENELGDLMHAAISLCVFTGFDPETALQKTLIKFNKRFNEVVRLAQQDGHTNLKGQASEILMSYWNKAKLNVG